MVSLVLIKALPGSSSADSSGPSSSVGKQISSSNRWRKASASSMLASNAFWSSLHTMFEHLTAFFCSKSQRCHTLVVVCTYPRNIQGFDRGPKFLLLHCSFGIHLYTVHPKCLRWSTLGLAPVRALNGDMWLGRLEFGVRWCW
jgi:hypothetical protein